MTSTIESIEKTVKNYFNNINKKIDNNEITTDEVKQQINVSYMYNKLCEYNQTVKTLQSEDVFLKLAIMVITEEIPKITERLNKPKKDDYTLNFLNKYVPKKHHNAIIQVDYDKLDGYFIYLSDDYIFSTTDGHYMNGLTLNEIKKEFKYIVKK
ncbi:hypothetical protein [Mammaliicoccus sp. E-M24]|uniref:hypothetical protein n=1 Tax=Mammaliicoccus sp. E-M24 TaxID=2898684 RepID=UPI001EFA7A74|nr:hypothetical protein [Mammaliicoccus sp. E-M24]